jgi:hypothetical protein
MSLTITKELNSKSMARGRELSPGCTRLYDERQRHKSPLRHNSKGPPSTRLRYGGAYDCLVCGVWMRCCSPALCSEAVEGVSGGSMMFKHARGAVVSKDTCASDTTPIQTTRSPLHLFPRHTNLNTTDNL